MRWIFWGVVAVILTGCQPTDSSTTSTEDDGESVSGETDGDAALPLSISQVRYTEPTSGPVMVVMETEVPTESELDILIDGTLVQQTTIPADCTELPALTVCEDSVARSVAVMTESGARTIEVVAMKGSLWRSETFTTTITSGACKSSAELYTNDVQPTLQNSCERCHGNGNAGVFDSDDDWTTFRTALLNRGDAFYRYPSGQDVGHDARPFSPYDPTYRLMAELVWRVEQGYTCP